MALGLIVALPAAAAGQLDWQTAPGYRWSELPVPAAGKTGFTLLPPQTTGISFSNHLSPERYLTNSILLNGSGVAAGDVDGDGLCDLYFCGLDGLNVLYRNLGNWRFQDVTAAAGVACPELDATGAVFADIDGDGDLDLIVNSLGGGTHIFINDGHGYFTRQTNTPPLNYGKAGASLALADIDGDGDLDLYVTGLFPILTSWGGSRSAPTDRSRNTGRRTCFTSTMAAAVSLPFRLPAEASWTRTESRSPNRPMTGACR